MSGEEIRPPSFGEELCRRIHPTRWEFATQFGACDECKTYVLAVIESDWLAADRASRTIVGTTVTEWGVRDVASGDVPDESKTFGDDGRWQWGYHAEGVADGAPPEEVVKRTVTSYAPHVTDWQVVAPTAAPTTEATS